MPTSIARAAGTSLVTIPDHLHASLRRLAERAYRRGPRASLGWTRNLCKVRPTSRNRIFDRAELTELGREVAEMVTRAKAKGSAE